MTEYYTERILGKKVLNVDFTGTNISASLNDPKCFQTVCKTLRVENPDRIVLIKDYRAEYGERDTNWLKIYARARISFDFGKKVLKKLPELKRVQENLQLLLNSNPEKALEETRKLLKEGLPVKNAARHGQETAIALAALKKLENRLRDVGVANPGKMVPVMVPSFVSSHIIPVNGKKTLLSSYSVKGSKVNVYAVQGMQENYYELKPKELGLHADEVKTVWKTLEELAGKEEDIPVHGLRERFKELAEQSLGEEHKKLADIIAVHSAGYGLLETLLSDEKVQDVYLDSPGGNRIYLYHEDHEECVTNIVHTNLDLEKLSARFRAVSGRPFDESSPVIDTELADLGVRVCGVREPATFQGTGFAFRRHKTSPWTLPEFINVGMIDSYTAGLLSFLVDAQKSILVTGPRGSGKTSFLSALLAELPTSYRVIAIEDTPELPVNQLTVLGRKVQHLRVAPAISRESYELMPEESLRTALRLGESVLVIGEVRGAEAKALFEAMRVGAAGNAVMGTIHGSSAYDTWDRIVNDLGVPSTSFKATDVVVSLAAFRESEALSRRRRLVSITEVKKDWKTDPLREKGFNDLLSYDPKKDAFRKKQLANSQLFKKIAWSKGITVQQAMKAVEARAKVKKAQVDLARKTGKQKLLGLEMTALINQKYYAEVTVGKKPDYQKAVRKVINWMGEQV